MIVQYCFCGYCGKPIKAIDKRGRPRRFCSGHALRKYPRGADHYHWMGGKSKNQGYVLIYMPDHPEAYGWGYVLEHRLIVEKKIGRYLERGEDVHHINGIRSDNRIENLELLSHAQHSKRTYDQSLRLFVRK